MSKITKEQKDTLLENILVQNQMLDKLRKLNRLGMFLFAIFLIITFWAFSGMEDRILTNISDSTRNIIGWITMVLCIIVGLMTILSLITFRNGKKNVLYQLKIIEGKEKLKLPQ